MLIEEVRSKLTHTFLNHFIPLLQSPWLFLFSEDWFSTFTSLADDFDLGFLMVQVKENFFALTGRKNVSRDEALCSLLLKLYQSFSNKAHAESIKLELLEVMIEALVSFKIRPKVHKRCIV